MAEITKFTKARGGVEDLLFDATPPSTETQARASGNKEITKINSATIPYAGKPGEAGFKSIKEELDSKVGVGEDIKVDNDNGALGITVGDADATWSDGTPSATEGTIFQRLVSGSYRWLMKMTLGGDNVTFRGSVGGEDATANNHFVTKLQAVGLFLGKTAKATDSDKLDGKDGSEYALINGNDSEVFAVDTPIQNIHATNKLYVDNLVDSVTENSLLLIKDVKPKGVGGGIFSSGAWRTRDLNTVDVNTIDGASLLNNQVTLPTGTYEVFGVAPAWRTGRNQAILYNITDAATAIIGSSADSGIEDFATTNSIIQGVITIADTKVFEVQHFARFSAAFGTALNVVSEVYAQIKFRKIA